MNAQTTRRAHGVDAIGRGIWRLWRVQCVACLLIGLALLAALGPRIAHADATATTVTVYPSDDATVRSWEPDQALGQDDYLELSYWPIDVPKGRMAQQALPAFHEHWIQTPGATKSQSALRSRSSCGA